MERLPPISEPYEFGISYEGDALIDNTMNIRDLAPALLALGELFDRANTLLNGDRASVVLQISAISPGSFSLSLKLQQLYVASAAFASGDFVTSAANMTDLILGGNSLVSIFKSFGGKKPQVVDQSPSAIVLDIGHVRIEVPPEAWRLFENRDIQKSAKAMVEPILRPGIERMTFTQRGNRIQAIEKDEAGFFGGAPDDEDRNEYEIPRAVLEVIAAVFPTGRKWQLSNGSKTEWYSIRDDGFLKEMGEGKHRFGPGDMLICRVRAVQRITAEGLRNEFIIERVLEHRTQGQQIPFSGQSNAL